MDKYLLTSKELSTLKKAAKHFGTEWRPLAARPSVAKDAIRKYTESQKAVA